MSDLAFVFAAGEGTYDKQGVFLARSIARTNPDAGLYVFVPNDESPANEEELAEHGTLLRGERTIPDYGISTKIDALRTAEETADEEYLLLLDTDTLVFDEITIHQEKGELFLKPVDIGLQYWGRESKSREKWHELADRLSLPTPEWRCQSTFDHNSIPPYWNAGFVLTVNDNFGARWLQAVQEIYPNIPYEWHADQVVLGLLSQEYDVTTLNENYNYPLHLRLQIPDDVVVAHYHDRSNLQKMRHNTTHLQEIDMWEHVQESEFSYLQGVWNYLKRKYLPINETHVFEQLRNRIAR